jgi:restriction system-associated AAA family ATPase
MKLHRIRLLDGQMLGILQEFEQVFAPQTDDGVEPYCFVGENGTGKSRLLQCIAEIFCWIDTRTRLFRPNRNAEIGFRFELEYEIHANKGPRRVLIRNSDNIKRPQVVEIDKEGEETAIEGEQAIRAILPRFVVGYTSGENETLSVPFLDVKGEYAAEVRERALFRRWKREDIPDLRLVMMDYHSNLSILVANFLLQEDRRLTLLEGFVRATGVESFRLIIQTKHRAAPKKIKIKIEDANGRIKQETREGVQLVPQLEEYIEQLKKCSTCHEFHEKESRWNFDFFVQAATRKAFKHFFGTAYNLCMAFQRLSMLNELIVPSKHRDTIAKIRRDEKIAIKPPTPAEEDKVFRFETIRLRMRDADDSLDYISISDGEHQFAHIFGTLLMFDQPNTLFLLDEPESHFNPQWRIKFVPLVNQIARGKHHCLLLSSHAPFIISDCKAQNVYIFTRSQDGRGVKASPPKTETYGASFDRLLEDVFGVKPPVARKSLDELRQLQHDGTKKEIENRLDDFGDSPVKFYLYQRLEKLKKEE